MKKVLKWTSVALLIPVVLIVLLMVLLYLPPVQKWAVGKVAAIASEETGMHISVGRVDLAFPLDLGLEQVVVVRENDTIADIGSALVHVQLLPLLKKQVVVDQLAISLADINTLDLVSDLQLQGHVGRLSVGSRGIDLERGTVQLNDARIADANLQILLSDTAAVDTTTSEMPWLINVDSLVVDRSQVEVHMPGDSMQVGVYIGKARAVDGIVDLQKGRYTVRSFDWQDGRLSYDTGGPKTYVSQGRGVSGGIDFDHIALTGIGIGLDSIFYSSPELMFRIRNAAMCEQSGLQLTQLQGTLMMDSTTIRVPRLTLRTPYSNIRARADVDFSVMDSIHPGRMDVDLDASVGKQDLMMFLAGQPVLLRERWPEWPLSLKAKVAGNRMQASIEQLDVTLPTAFHANAEGTIGLQANNNPVADLDLQAEAYDLGFLTAYVPDYGKGYLVPKGLHLQGSVKSTGMVYAARLQLNDGKGYAKVAGHYDQRHQSYDTDVNVSQLNLRRFLPQTGLGMLSASATARGRGTDFLKPSSYLEADGYIGQLQYDVYDIDSIQVSARLSNGHAIGSIAGHNLLLDGTITADALLGTRSLHATMGADLSRLDLRALHLADDPLAIGACGHIDVSSDMDQRHTMTGMFSDLYIHDSLKTYRPQDVGLLLRTDPDTTLVRLQSGSLIVKMDASGGLERLVSQFSTLTDTLMQQIDTRTIDQLQMKRQLPTIRLYMTSGNDNPVVNFLRSSAKIDFKELLVDLKTSPQSGINGVSYIYNLNADSTRIDTIRLNIVEKAYGLTFNGVVANNRRNPQLVFRALIDGRVQEHGGSFGVRFYDKDDKLGLRIGAQADMAANGIHFHLLPERPTIGYKEFALNADNFLFIQDNLRLKAKVDLIADDGTGVKIYSEEQDSTLLQDLTVSLHRFDLDQLTEILPFAPHITGELNGDYHLVMNERKQISVASDMEVKQMTYEQSPIGNIGTEFVYLQRENDTHALEGRLLLENKEVGVINGEYRNNGGGYLDAKMSLTHFPLDLVNGFIPDQLIGFEGFAEGEMSVQGTTTNLDVDGEVYLDSAALLSVPYGVRLHFDNDPVRVTDGRLLLENFTMYAYNDEPLNIMGNIDFHNLDRITLDMRMRARNYQIINSKQTSKSIAYGKAFVNFFAMLNGRLDQLRMRGRLDVLGTTDLTYILLDSPLSTDNQLDELVKFVDFNDSTETSVKKPTPDGIEVDLTLSIDQGAHVLCALNVDQTNYVDLFGGGDLRMKFNNDGINMTGRYTIGSGEMKYSLPVIPLKTFTIQDGSYVEFTGNPTNPRLNLTATERTKASVGQEGGQSRSVTFDCGVVITKTLNDMGLEFIISAPEDNSIDNELSSMTTEERGKLAVTMLTTGMYLADGNTSGFSMNSALSSFLQSEINNITGNALKTLDLSVGLDNTTDASGAMHTDYSFKFAKRFWNNRLKVQIGGKVSSGNDATAQRQNQSFFDNVTMEYRLSPTSNQYVKLFYKQNVYDWLEGYTGEYGGGFIWRRRLDNFWDILRFWRKEEQLGVRPLRPTEGTPRDSTGAGPLPTRTDSLKIRANENK